jgi:hypothetical protein
MLLVIGVVIAGAIVVVAVIGFLWLRGLSTKSRRY